MNIDALQNAIREKVSKNTGASPKYFLDKIRKNLMNLLCQSDSTEITGNVDDFGGPTPVSDDIFRGIVNLFSLAAVFNVDVSKELTELGKSLGAGNEAPRQPEATSGGNGGASGGNGSNQNNEAPETPNLEGKPKKIEMYLQAFREARDAAEIEAIWKNIGSDKALSGTDKFELQKAKQDASNGLARSA